MTHLLAVGLGYCGRHLLATHPHVATHVTGTSRTAQGAAALEAQGMRGLVFDGGAPSEALRAAIGEADILLLSAPPGPAGDPLMAAAHDLLATAPRLSQVIYLTTLGVYGDHGGAWVDERTRVNPGSDRLRRRIAAEADWLAFGARTGVPVASLRLAGIYGPGRNALLQIRAGEARRIDKPGQVFNRIHVDDIATAIAAVIARRFSGIVNVTDDLPAAPGEPVAYAAHLLGVPPPPLLPFEEAARAMSPMALTFWAGNKRVRNAVMKDALGVRLHYPTYREGLDALFAAGEGR